MAWGGANAPCGRGFGPRSARRNIPDGSREFPQFVTNPAHNRARTSRFRPGTSVALGRQHPDPLVGPSEGRMSGERGGTTPPGEPDARRRIRFRDYEHVLRMAGLFVAAIALFLAWRAWAVPADFGRYGHFRASAITDAAHRTPKYAGREACIECHGDVEQARQGGGHAKIGCEACHGPLGRHARAETDEAPVRPSPRAICLTCHTAHQGKPKSFPQVVVQEHARVGPCTDCHTAHKPGLT